MGGTESKNTTNIVNEVVQSVIMETVLKCKQSSNQTQQLIVKNSSNTTISDIDMSQYTSFNASCVLQQLSSTEFESNLQNALKQMAESQSSALNISTAKSENVSNITNSISQTVSNITKQDCVSNMFQEQSIIVEGSKNTVISNIKFEQIGKMVVTCLLKNETYNKLVNNLSNAVDQTSTAETTSLLDSVLPSFGLPSLPGLSEFSSQLMYVCSCICCVFIVLILFIIIIAFM